MLSYPVTLTPDTNGSISVSFTDLPEANSVGDNESEALANAVDALETAIEIYFDERRPVPFPSEPSLDQRTVSLPALTTAKVLIWNELIEQKLRKADLARLLNVHTPQVDRLFNVHHSSKMEFVEQAAKALGKRVSIQLV